MITISVLQRYRTRLIESIKKPPFGGLLLFQQAFFLQSAKGASCNVYTNLLAVDGQGAFLNVWLEDLASLSLGERYVVAVHFAFAGNFTNCHLISPLLY